MKGDGRIRGWMYATLLENPKYAPGSHGRYLREILDLAKYHYQRLIYPIRTVI